jgi:hypothetical protein
MRVVVDGSNLATEGRSEPSLAQLEDVVAAFKSEFKNAEIIVVADASFGHRIAVGERARFRDAEAHQEIVTPPAGAIGRGDAFILKIADRIGAMVLSNDSFQEFHGEYPWLFEADRLMGGKPVPGVGWVFTPRLPVRADKDARVVKKATPSLVGGVKPVIGTTVTPVKKTVSKKTVPAKKTVKKATPAKATKAIEPVKKAAKKTAAVKVAKKAAPIKKVAKVVKKAAPVRKVAPTPLLTRDRRPVNPESSFSSFRGAVRIGAKLEGLVTAFTSHGAAVKVEAGGAIVECYAPTANLGTPAPTRARDVLKRGERRTFKLISVDAERRTAELALV